jgi:hypothetical protein
MQIGDHVDVSLNTGKNIYRDIAKLSGRISKTVSNGDPMVSLTGVPEVYVIVEHPRGGHYEFGAPLSWFKDAGLHRWTLNMPDRGQFSLPDEEGT